MVLPIVQRLSAACTLRIQGAPLPKRVAGPLQPMHVCPRRHQPIEHPARSDLAHQSRLVKSEKQNGILEIGSAGAPILRHLPGSGTIADTEGVFASMHPVRAVG